jgi:hypothetical protein
MDDLVDVGDLGAVGSVRWLGTAAPCTAHRRTWNRCYRASSIFNKILAFVTSVLSV